MIADIFTSRQSYWGQPTARLRADDSQGMNESRRSG